MVKNFDEGYEKDIVLLVVLLNKVTIEENIFINHESIMIDSEVVDIQVIVIILVLNNLLKN